MTASPLDARLSAVVGGKTASALEKAFGYRSVYDLLTHFPRRYSHRGELTALSDLPVGEDVTIVAEVRAVRERRMQKRSGNVLEVVLTDGTGVISLTFFNQAWRMRELVPGVRGIFAGKVGMYNGQRQLAHPDYELFGDRELDEDSAEKWAQKPIPIYPATARIPSWRIAKMVDVALESLRDSEIEDALDGSGVLSFSEALTLVHQPESDADWKRARDALKYAEALVLQAALAQRRAEYQAKETHPRVPGTLLEDFDAALPFSLTSEQRAIGSVISSELASSHPMNRLVQGEVGTGKTVIAVRAMLTVAQDGGQSAFLAPTEVLAAQHFHSIVDALGPALCERIHPVLLTGSLSAEERRKTLLTIASGQSLIAVGTHALLSDVVTFADLGLVVVDEQHRFGVEQRDALRQKAQSTPHTLVLTATPIPRTVAMTSFGDLDVSTLKELPSGRAGITTHVVPLAEKPSWMTRVWQRVTEEVSAGRQVFVVAPAIDSSHLEEGSVPDGAAEQVFGESLGQDVDPALVAPPMATVMQLAEDFSHNPDLAHLRSCVVHGRLPAVEKDEVMQSFSRRECDVLIATTVIEVGVNIPNASTMIIMDADRFGIAQLHQLRGRVGRGEHAGLCLLVTRAPEGSLARQRVDAVAATTDGFELADIDLELRREGDVLGASQSGAKTSLKLLRVTRDRDVIEKAREHAVEIITVDPTLTSHPGLAAAIARRVELSDTSFLTKS